MKNYMFYMFLICVLASCSIMHQNIKKTSAIGCEFCNNELDDVCANPDKYAVYGESDQDLFQFIRSIKFQTIDKSNFTFYLTICKHGKVVDVLPKIVNSASDSIVLENIKEMHKWNPALKDGHEVKSIYRMHFYIKPQ